jgi:3-dehydroquinate synthase
MKNITVHTKLKNYQISIQPDITDNLPSIIKDNFKDVDKIALITNDKVYGLYGERLKKLFSGCNLPFETIIIQDGEKYKNLMSAQIIYGKLISSNFHRNDLIIAFGGGVIGDLAGFAASTFHRGLKFIQCPTTIIGQVDSSIGGKVVVNFDSIKNVIGSFYQPDMVLIDPVLLYTLDKYQIINGLAEIVKYGIIFDKNILNTLNKNIGKENGLDKIDFFVKYNDSEQEGSLEKMRSNELINLTRSSVFPDLIYKCCQIKVKVVEKDEFDTGYRNLLNFGHTVGHAIEKVVNLEKINHGMAVSMGMIVAIDISINLGLAKENIRDKILKLYEKLSLPYTIPKLNVEELISAMQFDKKFTGKGNKFVLIRDINKPEISYNVDEKVIVGSVKKNMTGQF